MAWLTEVAPAKVNLSLLITDRRDDGYHMLDSLVVFGPAADRLHARAAPKLSLRIDGPFGSSLAAEPDNLVLRAARALAVRTGYAAGAELVLEKHLPVASGIGGGSADAAAALRLLCRLWGVDCDLAGLALTLGADVPVCVDSRPAHMRGVGDALAALPKLPQCGLLLVNPGIGVATADVFRARTGAFSPPAASPRAWVDAEALAATLAGLGNDLEAAAIGLAPVIGAVLRCLRALPGCLLARMSGSGATCYALFEDPAAADREASAVPGGWWRAAGPLYEPSASALLTGAEDWGVAKR